MDFKTFSAKNVDAATALAVAEFHVPAEELIIEVLDKGNTGLFGIGSRPAVIQAKRKFTLEGAAKEFLDEVFHTMNMEVVLDIIYNDEEKTMDIDLKGDDMGILIGGVIAEPVFSYGDVVINEDDAVKAWTETLDKVFPSLSGAPAEPAKIELYDAKNIVVCKNKIARPKVFIPVFPGTNCEYDSTKAFERAGADVTTKVFKNMTAANIRDSVDEFVKCIEEAQIVMFPGGFSAGDEPEGSAKFFATAFRNDKVKDAIERLLQERDGLMLGICNGFQALIKLGLVPYGTITTQTEDSPTLTYNTIGRHISKMAYTKVVTNKSPWLAQAELGGVYCNPASHGEGRFVASKEWIEKLMANGQIATQYVDADGNLAADEYWNINGSYCAIEGITSPDGRILGKMAHSERRGKSVAVNIYGEQDMKLFESGVAYFK